MEGMYLVKVGIKGVGSRWLSNTMSHDSACYWQEEVTRQNSHLSMVRNGALGPVVVVAIVALKNDLCRLEVVKYRA